MVHRSDHSEYIHTDEIIIKFLFLDTLKVGIIARVLNVIIKNSEKSHLRKLRKI
jgi:hypothetical protein